MLSATNRNICGFNSRPRPIKSPDVPIDVLLEIATLLPEMIPTEVIQMDNRIKAQVKIALLVTVGSLLYFVTRYSE